MTYRDEAKASRSGKVSRVLNGANKSNSDSVMASEGAKGTSPISHRVDNVSLKAEGKKSKERFDRPARARGGSVKKGKTNVTVIVAPQGGAGASPGVAVAGGPPPMMPPPGGAPMGGPPPGAMPPSGGMPPPRPPVGPPPQGMPMRARGGRTTGGAVPPKTGKIMASKVHRGGMSDEDLQNQRAMYRRQEADRLARKAGSSSSDQNPGMNMTQEEIAAELRGSFSASGSPKTGAIMKSKALRPRARGGMVGGAGGGLGRLEKAGLE